MPRIPYPDLATIIDPEILGYLEEARLHGTPRPESQAIRAHVPAVIRAFSQAWQATFRTGVLDHAIKELCRAYVSQSIECEYCKVQRSGRPESGGIAETAYAKLLFFEESDDFTEREKAALAYADAIVWDATRADDALWERLHRHFTDPELVELGFFIGLTLGQQRWIKTLDIGHHEFLAGTQGGLAPRDA